MSSFGVSSKIQFADTHSVDAFSRLRAAEPESIFESQLQYDDAPLLWDTYIEGSGSTLHIADQSTLELNVGTTAGDLVVRQTFQYHRYQPGKSQLVLMTGHMGDAKDNVRKRIGYFDGYNGLFFQQDGYINSVVIRNSNGGITDTIIPQSQWNLDKMDGNGISGFNINLSLVQIFVIDFQWLGAGRVRFGFGLHGDIHYCHEVLNANHSDSTYITTANLPTRYEIENTDNTTSASNMKQICTAVISEGGLDSDKGLDFSASTGITGASITTRTSVLTIRPKDTFGGQKNRCNIIPLDFEIYAETNAVFYEIVYKGTLATPTWTSVNADSLAEYSVTHNAVTGGIVVASGFVSVGVGSKIGISSNTIEQRVSLDSDILGTSIDEFSVVCTPFTGTANVRASIRFKERR